jgi:hypothetical protein
VDFERARKFQGFIGTSMTAKGQKTTTVIRIGEIEIECRIPADSESRHRRGRYGNGNAIGPQDGIGPEKVEFHVATF